MEYIHNAQQIFNLVKERIIKYINKVSSEKRYKHFVKSSQYTLWNSPIYYAEKVYVCCQLANKMRNPETRLSYLNQASDNLVLLKSSVQTFYDHYRKIIKEKFVILLAQKVETQERLLKGCKENTKNVGCQRVLT